MKFEVLVTDAAEEDLRQAYEFIKLDSPSKAEAWLTGMTDVILGLETMPAAYGAARESQAINTDLRQVVYKSFRVIFQIRGRSVIVIRVLHTARRNINQPDGE